MKHNSPFGVGRLMRAAICGLLAATVIPAAALADGGIVGGVTASTPVPTVTVSAPTLSVPDLQAPSVSVSTSVSAPVGSQAVAVKAAARTTKALSSTSQGTKAQPNRKRKGKRPAKRPRGGWELVAQGSATVGRALQAAATVSTTRQVAFTGTSTCTGEMMVGTATLHDVLVVNDNGTMHDTETIQGIKAVGATTGLTYVGSEEVTLTSQNFPIPDPNFVFETDTTYKLTRIGELSGPGVPAGMSIPDDMVMKAHVHTTVNANLEVTSVFSKPFLHCN